MLTIAHITDLHIAPGRPANDVRLAQALAAIHRLKPRPAVILATGDLTDHGAREEYDILKLHFEKSEIAILAGVGNHDLRAPFRAAFPDTPAGDGFVQYVKQLGDLRIVMLDTIEEGLEGGAFCEKRAAWLEDVLRDPAPTLVALHHPPVMSGVGWMDPRPDADWIRRLERSLRGRGHVRGIVAGHMHRAFHAPFAGHTLTVSAATSVQLTLDFTALDRQAPDGREILNEAPPGFSLLVWDNGVLTTHSCLGADYPSAMNFTAPLS